MVVFLIVIQFVFVYLNYKLLLSEKLLLTELSLLGLFSILAGLVYSVVGSVLGEIVFVSMLMFLAMIKERKNYIGITGMVSYSLIILIVSNHCATLIDMHIFKDIDLFSDNFFLMINQIIGCLFSMVITLSVAKFLKYAKSKLDISNETKRLIYVIGIITSSMLYILLFLGIVPNNRVDLIGLNLFFLSIYLIVSLITFFMYLSSIRGKYEIQKKEREYSENQRYMELMESQYKEVRKFRHDYKNILNSLEDFIVDEDYEGLNHYYFDKIKRPPKLLIKMIINWML
ncbi:hypothetical protein [Candidatus Enterococcus mansonii]|uniref:SpoOB alpha-helical domain-containing protein n=1 Tax=Candidatus Enterococcus mansonii TaxID=1834181 RepID=A0ABU8IFB2_9ENTE